MLSGQAERLATLEELNRQKNAALQELNSIPPSKVTSLCLISLCASETCMNRRPWKDIKRKQRRLKSDSRKSTRL